MKDFRRILEAAVTVRDTPWCLATLVKAEGSSYRQPGARLLVLPDGGTIGFLSGGCLEEEIARHGARVLSEGKPQLVFFDTRRLFGCDGRLSIYLEKIEPASRGGNFLTNIAERLERRALCRVTVPYEAREASALLPDRALVVRRDGVLTEDLSAPNRLLVFGDGPETGPLAAFAKGLGWIFQGHSRPDDLPDDFAGDTATAAVVMTHKFGRDLAALNRLSGLTLGYLGLLGPRKRHLEILRRYQDFRNGDLPSNWAEILHAPAGLDTGSESPEEIALSITAEVAAVLAGREGGFLRKKTGAIHRMEARA